MGQAPSYVQLCRSQKVSCQVWVGARLQKPDGILLMVLALLRVFHQSNCTVEVAVSVGRRHFKLFSSLC